MPKAGSVGRFLIGAGCVAVLGIAGVVVVYLVSRFLQGGFMSTADFVVAAVLTALVAGAIVVLLRLFRGKPTGWLPAPVLLFGLGLPAGMALAYLLGTPFVY